MSDSITIQQFVQYFGGGNMTLGAFLVMSTLWPALLNLATGKSDLVISRLRSMLRGGRYKFEFEETASKAFEKAVSRCYNDWYREIWPGRRRNLSRAGKVNAKQEKDAVEEARDYLQRYSRVIFANMPIRDSYFPLLNCLVARTESPSQEIQDQLIADILQYIPQCPISFQKIIQSRLIPYIGNEYADLLQNPSSSEAHHSVTTSIVLQLLEEINEDGVKLSANEKQELSKIITTGVTSGVKLILADCRQTKAVQANLENYHENIVSMLREHSSILKAISRDVKDLVEKPLAQLTKYAQDTLAKLKTSVEEYGFRDIEQILGREDSKYYQPQPWPTKEAVGWPYWSEFVSNKIVKVEVVEELRRLFTEGGPTSNIYLLYGRSGHGKTTVAKYLGFLLVSDEDTPWQVYYLDVAEITDFYQYGFGFKHKFLDHLRGFSELSRPVLFIIDNIHAYAGEFVQLLKDWQGRPPFEQVNILLIANYTLGAKRLTPGERLLTLAEQKDIVVNLSITKEDFINYIRICLRHVSSDKIMDFDTEDYDHSIREIFSYCHSWSIIYTFMKRQQLQPGRRFFWGPMFAAKGFNEYRFLSDLRRDTQYQFDSLTYDEERCLLFIASLGSMGIWVDKQILDQCFPEEAIVGLLRRQLFYTMPGTSKCSVGHPKSAQLLLRCLLLPDSSVINNRLSDYRQEFDQLSEESGDEDETEKFTSPMRRPTWGTTWQDLQDRHEREALRQYLKEYILLQPPNLLHTLKNPIFASKVYIIQDLFTKDDHYNDVVEAIKKYINNNTSLEQHINLLHSVHQVNRSAAQQLFEETFPQLMYKIREYYPNENFPELVELIRRLTFINRRLTRDLYSPRWFKPKKISEILLNLCHETQSHQFTSWLDSIFKANFASPKLVRAIKFELNDSSFWTKFTTVAHSLDLEQLSICLRGLFALDFEQTREYINSVNIPYFNKLCHDVPLPVLVNSLKRLVYIDAGFISDLTASWTSSDGQLPNSIEINLGKIDKSSQMLNAIFILGDIDSRLAAMLVTRVSIDGLLQDWQAHGGYLRQLNDVLFRLRKLNMNTAAYFSAQVPGSHLMKAFSHGINRPIWLVHALNGWADLHPNRARHLLTWLFQPEADLYGRMESWVRGNRVIGVGALIAAIARAVRYTTKSDSETNTRNLWNVIEQIKVPIVNRGLPRAIENKRLTVITRFFHQLTKETSLGLLAEEIVDEIADDLRSVILNRESYGLVDILELLSTIETINSGLALELLENNRKDFLVNFQVRLQERRADLHEVGKSLTIFSRISPDTARDALSLIEWDILVDDAEFQTNTGRIAHLLAGLEKAGFVYDTVASRILADFLLASSRAWEEEQELSRISEAINGLSKIGYPQGKIFSDEIVSQHRLLELIEQEPQISRIVQTYNILANHNGKAYESILNQVNIRAQAGKLYHNGDLKEVLAFLASLDRLPGQRVKTSISPYVVNFVGNYLDAQLGFLFEKQRDLGVISSCLRYIMLANENLAEEILIELSPKRMARQISGIRDISGAANVTEIDQSDHVRRLMFNRNLAKLASFLFIGQKINPDWTKTFLFELNNLHSTLPGAQTTQAYDNADLWSSIANSDFVDPFQLTVLARHTKPLIYEKAQVLLAKVDVAIMRADFHKLYGIINSAWAIWTMLQDKVNHTNCRELVEKLSNRADFNWGKVEQIALNQEKEFNVSAVMAAYGLDQSWPTQDFWTSFMQVFDQANQDVHPLVLQAILLTGSEEEIVNHYTFPHDFFMYWDDEIDWLIFDSVLRIRE